MTDLTEKAMLVSLTIRRWKATVTDREVSDRVADDHNADRSFGRFSKRLIAKDALQEVAHAARQARGFHAEETLPWLADGTRILSAKNFLAYTQAMKAHKADFENAAAAFVTDYPRFVDEAKTSLNGLFRREDYPDVGEIAKSFEFAINVFPLPSGRDFRVAMSSEEANAIRAEIEAKTRAAVVEASREVWSRAEEAIRKLREKAEAVDNEEKVIVRGAVFEAVRGVAGIMDRLNITDDPEMERIRRRIETELLTVEPETLRKDAEVRKAVRRSADSILSAMAGYVG